jgi:2-oxoglutarate dehydrogenase E1 component
VLGFEYGYSTALPETLVLWEAQFGDFANMAQAVIDQFISADHAKWGQDSGVVLLLPHGYEGQGPSIRARASSAFSSSLPSAACASRTPRRPRQYFHLLRRQARTTPRRPLVLMQPKSMLRLSAAASRLADLATGSFQPVIDDPAVKSRDEVTRLAFCSGKLYYELSGSERPAHLAVVRVEELYPWPHELISRVVDLYPNVAESSGRRKSRRTWALGAYVAPRLRASAGNALIIRYIGRPERASPAEGYPSSHTMEQGRIVADVLAAPNVPGQGARPRAMAR